MQLGKAALIVFPQTATLHELAGPIAYVVGFLVGIIMWGFGLAWLFFAAAAIARRGRIPFNMGW
jgi:tellurite resistance protein TehA-like permease